MLFRLLNTTRHTAFSFALILAAYTLYALAAVPFIEPSVTASTRQAANLGPRAAKKDRLDHLFPPGSWELDNPKVLETAHGKLLFKDFRTLSDGRLEIKPCTVVYQVAASGSGEQARPPRTVLLQAPEGAVMYFDGELNFSRGQFGRLRSGQLVGRVTIQSAESRPGAGDVLLVETANVQMARDRIVAPGDVSFHYGGSYGSGRELTLLLSLENLPDARKEKPAATDANAAKAKPGKAARVSATAAGLERLRSLELKRVDKVHLAVEELRELQQPAAASTTVTVTAKTATPPNANVELTCQGPFRIDFGKGVATFNDRVAIVRLNTPAANDQLTCQTLSVYFSQRPNSKPAADKADKTAKSKTKVASLEVDRVVAEGAPAWLQAPSYRAAARGQWLELDLKANVVRVRDPKQVLLDYQQSHVEARELEYKFEPDGRLGELRATGPGIARGVIGGGASGGEPLAVGAPAIGAAEVATGEGLSGGKTYEATWNEQLVLQKHQGSHVFSLVAGGKVRQHGLGEFAADRLHVWLREVPRPPQADGKPRFEYRADRMLAEKNVRIDSLPLTGATQKAEVWVRYSDEPLPTSEPAPRNPSPDNRGAPNRRPQRFDVQSDRIQVQLVRQGERTEVEHLILDGQVRFRETQTSRPEDAPFAITGQIVQIERAQSPDGSVLVRGSPAEITARGLTMTGPNIELQRRENRLSIVGPGGMSMPASRLRTGDSPGGNKGPMPIAANSAELATAETVAIAWKGRMDFDGQRITVARDVKLTGVQSNRQGETHNLLLMGHDLEVILNQPIDFSQTKQPADVAMQRLAFRGGVFLQNHSRRGDQPLSHDQMQIRDLSLDQATGRLHAHGPGWASTVRHGSDPAAASALPLGRPTSTSATAADSGELTYVRVDFEDEMHGRMDIRQAEFRGRVRTIYGPVAAWDATLDSDPLDGLGPNQFLLTSERLSLAQLSQPAGATAPGSVNPANGNTIEIEATKNATIEGQSFTARGSRMAYAHAKRLLILEGDGRNDAELWLRGSTSPDAAAQRIRFWTDSQRFDVDGGRFLNLPQTSDIRP